MSFVLPLYLSDTQKGGFGLNDVQTAALMGSLIALVYFTPLIGGLLADRVLGYRRTIVIGAFLMMIGYLALALPGSAALYAGLGLMILGNGAFKPNISTLLGNLYPQNSPNRDAGYNIFYMGINIGAFVSPFAAAIVRNYVDEHPIVVTSTWTINGWHAALGTAGLGMFIGLVIFSSFWWMFRAADQRKASTDRAASLTPLWLECLLPAAVIGGVCWVLLHFFGKALHVGVDPLIVAFLAACLPVALFYFNVWRRVQDRAERARVLALIVIFAVAIVFWTTFYLPNTAITFWGRSDTNRRASGVVEHIEKVIPGLTENADPSYFANAAPNVPRPARSTFQVVSDEEYKQLEKEKKLTVVEGKPIYVTQKMLDEVYAKATPETPTLPPGKDLKVINTEEYQAINPLYIVLFTPLVVVLWIVLRRWKAEPSTSAKMGFGLLLAALSPLVMLGAVMVSHDGAVKASSWWIFGYYVPITFGELFLSPMGLSLVNKMAPRQISALMMGGWFVSTAIGVKLSGILGQEYSQMSHYTFWAMLVGLNAFFGIVLLALVPWLNRQMATRS
jgi:proton-dependent oligopeptide transporter, POT family